MKRHENIINKIWKNHGKNHGQHHEKSIFYLKMTRQIDLRNHQDRQLVETLREKADLFFKKNVGKRMGHEITNLDLLEMGNGITMW
jgi:hypothetical protein